MQRPQVAGMLMKPAIDNVVSRQIEQVLDQIRPAIRADGGDVQLVGFDETTGGVAVRMVGACYACPMSMATLRAGIEQRLRMVVPEVHSVEAVE